MGLRWIKEIFQIQEQRGVYILIVSPCSLESNESGTSWIKSNFKMLFIDDIQIFKPLQNNSHAELVQKTMICWNVCIYAGVKYQDLSAKESSNTEALELLAQGFDTF